VFKASLFRFQNYEAALLTHQYKRGSKPPVFLLLEQIFGIFRVVKVFIQKELKHLNVKRIHYK